ncbi:MAG: hypothetical protein DRJ31_10475 [Candidatus Methanomethylicota archaeon]|uniref:DUF3368 domain-containing protein n=1 Tax=Thermoproteota archaeon TaxID=2056631 RepID=A0A497EJG4_9CREN|nr:MAG: hypothetical protein DRJ31_10475 [Candidatus Verstraetearchaeota archaeon]
MSVQEQCDKKTCLIINSSTIITLSELNKLDLIGRLSRKFHIIIPKAVIRELSKNSRISSSIAAYAVELAIDKSISKDLQSSLEGLGEGEKEVLVMAYAINRSGGGLRAIAVIDERVARRKAKALGILVTGLLGLIICSKKASVLSLDEAMWMLNQLPNTSLYVTRDLIEKAKLELMKTS